MENNKNEILFAISKLSHNFDIQIKKFINKLDELRKNLSELKSNEKNT